MGSEVNREEAAEHAKSINVGFMETSAKAGHNVKSLFRKIADDLPNAEKDNAAKEGENKSAYTSLSCLFNSSVVYRGRRFKARRRSRSGFRMPMLI